jgi:hydrogenase maturation protease
MTTRDRPAVVIGVGNVLLADDAVGIRVVEALREVPASGPGALPDGTRLVDGGTLGLDLLRAVEGARTLVLVDAVDLGAVPGTVRVLRGDALATAGRSPAAAADGGVASLLAVGRLMGWLPDPVSLVGVQVERVEAGIGLSTAVRSALPAAVEAVRRELRELDELAGHDRDRRPVAGPVEGATA